MDKLTEILFESRLCEYFSVVVIVLAVLYFVGQVVRAIFF